MVRSSKSKLKVINYYFCLLYVWERNKKKIVYHGINMRIKHHRSIFVWWMWCYWTHCYSDNMIVLMVALLFLLFTNLWLFAFFSIPSSVCSSKTVFHQLIKQIVTALSCHHFLLVSSRWDTIKHVETSVYNISFKDHSPTNHENKISANTYLDFFRFNCFDTLKSRR